MTPAVVPPALREELGRHGTFIARALLGLGVKSADWPFAAAMPMPMPMVYRLWITDSGVVADGPGCDGRTGEASPLFRRSS